MATTLSWWEQTKYLKTTRRGSKSLRYRFRTFFWIKWLFPTSTFGVIMCISTSYWYDSLIEQRTAREPWYFLLYPTDHACSFSVLHEWRPHSGGHRRKHQGVGAGRGRWALSGSAQWCQPGTLWHQTWAFGECPDLWPWGQCICHLHWLTGWSGGKVRMEPDAVVKTTTWKG